MVVVVVLKGTLVFRFGPRLGLKTCLSQIKELLGLGHEGGSGACQIYNNICFIQRHSH